MLARYPTHQSVTMDGRTLRTPPSESSPRVWCDLWRCGMIQIAPAPTASERRRFYSCARRQVGIGFFQWRESARRDRAGSSCYGLSAKFINQQFTRIELHHHCGGTFREVDELEINFSPSPLSLPLPPLHAPRRTIILRE